MARQLVIAICGLLAACVSGERAGFETVDARYATGGGEWDRGGGITAVARLFGRDGATIVCGAWATSRQSALTVELNENVIEAASVFAGRTRVAQNLRFMTRLRSPEDLQGGQASCIASRVAWRPELGTAETRIVFPQMAFVLDDEVGLKVTFRQTGGGRR